jgi:hypothetical protein
MAHVAGTNDGVGYGVNGEDGTSGITPAKTAGIWGDSKDGYGAHGTSANWDGVLGETKSAAHAGVSGINNGGGFGIWASGQPAGHLEGNLEVNGDAHVTGTLTVDKDIVMPAADFAEDFPVEASELVDPGTVMVLDKNGILRPSDKQYDRKVVGVISGAGDYRTGLILDRHESSIGRLPLALVGKVYCKVDATYGQIEVGDLLTTSPTAGHAMKADDPMQAFGAVLGKALRPLESGCGLIPILVTLQ